MGLDIFLFKYNKIKDLQKTTYSEEEIEKLEFNGNWETFSTCPKALEPIAAEITVGRSYYDMKRISNDFANGEPLEIGMMGGGIIGFRNYEKNIHLDLDSDMINDKYTYSITRKEYAVEYEEIAYWRKANQIRQWFVNHIQTFYASDNCGYYQITEDLLNNLLSDCLCVLMSHEEIEIPDNIKEKIEKVRNLANHGVSGEKTGAESTLKKLEQKYGLTGVSVKPEQIMPTSEGFFFGGTENDDYYYEQIKKTVQTISKILETVDWNNDIIMYNESW